MFTQRMATKVTFMNQGKGYSASYKPLTTTTPAVKLVSSAERWGSYLCLLGGGQLGALSTPLKGQCLRGSILQCELRRQGQMKMVHDQNRPPDYEWRERVLVLLRANGRLRALADAQAELKSAVLNELRISDPTNPFLDKQLRKQLMLMAYHRALVDAEDENDNL